MAKNLAEESVEPQQPNDVEAADEAPDELAVADGLSVDIDDDDEDIDFDHDDVDIDGIDGMGGIDHDTGDVGASSLDGIDRDVDRDDAAIDTSDDFAFDDDIDISSFDDREDRGTDVGGAEADEPESLPYLQGLEPYGIDAVSELEPVPTIATRTGTFLASRSRPYESPGRSARNHWIVVAAFSLVGVLLGVAYGVGRAPTYTAEARLVVGKTAQLSNLASIPGLDAAGQSLAASYARLAATDEVQSNTVKRLGHALDGSLSASPIPESAVIRLEATSKSPEGALATAKAGTGALIDAVNTLNEQQNQSAENILKQYADADKVLITAQTRLQGLQAAVAAGTPQGTLQEQINAAKSEVDTAQVKVDALATTYNQVFNPSEINSQVIQRAGAAGLAGNNRKSTIEAAALVGLVAGALLGLGLAVFLDLRARTRR